MKGGLQLMYRARYLALLVYGEGHPDLATFDVCFLRFIPFILRTQKQIVLHDVLETMFYSSKPA